MLEIISRVYPTSRPMTAGIGASNICEPYKDNWLRKWIDGYIFGESIFNLRAVRGLWTNKRLDFIS